MERGSERKLWRIDLSSAKRDRDACWPRASPFLPVLATRPPSRLHVSEAWRHRVLAIDDRARARRTRGALRPSSLSGTHRACVRTAAIWLALFAPRNQLVEFVLREDAYRRRMIDTIDPALLDRARALKRRELSRADPGRSAQEAEHAEAVVAELVVRARRALQSDDAASCAASTAAPTARSTASRRAVSSTAGFMSPPKAPAVSSPSILPTRSDAIQ